MNISDCSQKLLENTLSILKSHEIEDTTVNRLKYLIPVVYEEKNPLFLRDCALFLSSQIIDLSSQEELSLSSSFVYDLFSLIKTKADVFSSGENFYQALHYFIMAKESDLEDPHSSTYEMLRFLFYREIYSRENNSQNFITSFQSARFSAACTNFLGEVLQSSTRKKCTDALQALKYFNSVFLKGITTLNLDCLIEALRHTLDLGQNELYQTAHLFIERASFSYKSPVFRFLVEESKPPSNVLQNYRAWIKCFLTICQITPELRASNNLETLWDHLSGLEETLAAEDTCLISKFANSNDHSSISLWIRSKINQSKTMKTTTLSLNLAKIYLDSTTSFQKSDFALLEDLCRLRDSSSSDFSLNHLIESSYANVVKSSKNIELLNEVPLYDHVNSVFRAWMLPYIERYTNDDIGCFHKHIYPLILADNSMDESISLSLWAVFPAFLINTADISQFSVLFQEALKNIKAHEIIRGQLLNSLASWLEKNPFEISFIQELCVLCLDLFCNEPSKHEYILGVLGKLLRFNSNSEMLLNRLVSQIKAISLQNNPANFIRLLEPFGSALPNSRRQIFDFSVLLIQNYNDENLVRAAFKVITFILKIDKSLIDASLLKNLRKAPTKEKLKCLCVVPATLEVTQEFLAEVIFSTKDTSEKTRILAKEVLTNWSREQNVIDLLKLAFVGLIGTSSAMISGTIYAIDIILQNGNMIDLDDKTFVNVFIASFFSIADESTEVVKSIMILLLNLMRNHTMLFEGDLLDKSIEYIFFKPHSSFHHIMQQLKEFLAIAGSTFGWDRLGKLLPKKDQVLLSYVRKEHKNQKLLSSENKKKRSGKDWTRGKKEKVRILA